MHCIVGSTAALTGLQIQVTDEAIEEQQQIAKDELLRLAACAEQGSDHPLSRAVLQAAKKRGLVLQTLAEDACVYYVGSGVKCDTGSGVVLVGNRGLMEEQQVREGKSCVIFEFSISNMNNIVLYRDASC